MIYRYKAATRFVHHRHTYAWSNNVSSGVLIVFEGCFGLGGERWLKEVQTKLKISLLYLCIWFSFNHIILCVVFIRLTVGPL